MNRKESPLRRAEDAYLLDNDNLSIPQQEEWLLNLYHKLTEGQQ
jgi:cytidylate kinase